MLPEGAWDTMQVLVQVTVASTLFLHWLPENSHKILIQSQLQTGLYNDHYISQ